MQEQGSRASVHLRCRAVIEARSKQQSQQHRKHKIQTPNSQILKCAGEGGRLNRGALVEGRKLTLVVGLLLGHYMTETQLLLTLYITVL